MSHADEDVGLNADTEDAFRLLVDTVQDYAIFMLDRRGNVASWNRGAQRIKGYTAAEIVGQHFSRFYPEDAVACGHPGNGLDIAAREGRFEEEGWRVRKDGTTFWASVVITALRDARGRMRGYAKVTRDMTDRKRHEEALRLANVTLESRVIERTEALARANADLARKEEWLRVTLSSIGDAVIATGVRTEITLMNPVAEALTGWKFEDAAGAPLAQVFRIFNEYTRKPAANPALRAIREGVVVGLANDSVLVTKDGREIPIDDSAAPIRGGGGETIGCVLIFRDVSERKQAQRILERSEKRKDEFLAVLSHELRNPLAPIRNAVQFLRTKLPSPDSQVDWARDVIDRQVDHLGRLLDDLLDVSRIAQNKLALQFEWTDLGALIDAAVEVAAPWIDARRQQLEVRLPEERIRAYADPFRLSQVFTNLLNNASKYTPAGGTISVALQKGADAASITVTDTGIGIDPDFLPQVFDLFSQHDRASSYSPGGLGIGLSLARRLVQLHGGEIRAESAGSDAGSRFTVTLPLGDPQAAEHAKALLAQPQRSRALRILVIDDNRDAAETMAELLRLEKHEVHDASSGEQGLAEALHFNPHAVILDIGLPDIDGYAVARRLRSEPWGRNLLLIALTGWGKEQDKELARQAGFDHHLTKPADLRELTRMLMSGRDPAGASRPADG